MSDSEEMTKLVDTIYKNILEKFNPSARQLITAGKAYLKALHGASVAAKVYVEAIVRLARNAQQGTWGGAADIGTALMQIVDVYKEIQAQQVNLLKAFYVDLLVPIETNIEKDTKVVQGEQKKFMQQHKVRQEAYLKAAGTVKKQRKKSKSSRSSVSIDKEFKQMQILEEEKNKLDDFCEQSLRNAIAQERRRYGFVLERQCSLAKHLQVYHTKGQVLLQHHLDQWESVAKTREFLPEVIEGMFPCRIKRDDRFCSSDDEYDRLSIISSTILRKTKGLDSSCLDLRSLHSDAPTPKPLTRAKSDLNLASSHQSLYTGEACSRPRSMAVAAEAPVRRELVRALYSYLSSGDHQLSFHESDLIALIGERNKGWQYGENLRNHRSGWFPIAYTEPVPIEEQEESVNLPSIYQQRFHSLEFTSITGSSSLSAQNRSVSTFTPAAPLTPFAPSGRPHSMYVDGSLSRASSISKASEKSGSSSGQDEGRSRSPPPPPPPLPSTSSSPIPDLTGDSLTPEMTPRRVCRSFTSPVPLLAVALQSQKGISGTNASHHSSNDSGFCNETNPTPMPKVDYADMESPKDNIFSTVKLRKTVTNDRSAPMLS